MDNVGIYRTTKYMAYLYSDHIVICTNLQCVRIAPMRYSETYINLLKLAIINGEVANVSDLVTHNGRLTWNNCSKPQSPALA